jgi:hypothetical protein
MRTITFPEFCQIINNSAAIILDNNALSYPYVESYDDENGETFYDRVEISYNDERGFVEHSFYSDDTVATILDDDSIKLRCGDDFYNIIVLEKQKLS